MNKRQIIRPIGPQSPAKRKRLQWNQRFAVDATLHQFYANIVQKTYASVLN